MSTVVLPPDDSADGKARIQRLVDFWNYLRVHEEYGAATGEEIDSLERQVTECWAQSPPDIDRADTLTAQAMLLIAGCSDL